MSKIIKIVKAGPFSAANDFEKFELKAPGKLVKVTAVCPETIMSDHSNRGSAEIGITCNSGDINLLNCMIDLGRVYQENKEQRVFHVPQELKTGDTVNGYIRVNSFSKLFPASDVYVKLYFIFEK